MEKANLECLISSYKIEELKKRVEKLEEKQ